MVVIVTTDRRDGDAVGGGFERWRRRRVDVVPVEHCRATTLPLHICRTAQVDILLPVNGEVA